MKPWTAISAPPKPQNASCNKEAFEEQFAVVPDSPDTKFKAMMDDARSDPDASQKLEVFAFIEKTVANLKAQEDSGTGEE